VDITEVARSTFQKQGKNNFHRRREHVPASSSYKSVQS
jgi:hypothetical protein